MDYIQEIKDKVNTNLVYNPVLGFCLPELIQKALELGMISKTEYEGNSGLDTKVSITEWRVLNKELYADRTNTFKSLKIKEAIETLKQEKLTANVSLDPLSEIPF